MTWSITACSNDARRIVESQTRTTCPKIRDLVAASLRAQGFLVLIAEEP